MFFIFCPSLLEHLYYNIGTNVFQVVMLHKVKINFLSILLLATFGKNVKFWKRPEIVFKNCFNTLKRKNAPITSQKGAPKNGSKIICSHSWNLLEIYFIFYKPVFNFWIKITIVIKPHQKINIAF